MIFLCFYILQTIAGQANFAEFQSDDSDLEIAPPSNLDLFFARRFFERKEYGEAISDIQRLLEFWPTDVQLNFCLVILEIVTGDIITGMWRFFTLNQHETQHANSLVSFFAEGSLVEICDVIAKTEHELSMVAEQDKGTIEPLV